MRIRRPTIVVGGELVLDNLEITPNPATGVAEAPLQLKSNCGTLVIDDFGRQQVAPAALLNRWIVPLEKRYDFLNLTSGRKSACRSISSSFSPLICSPATWLTKRSCGGFLTRSTFAARPKSSSATCSCSLPFRWAWSRHGRPLDHLIDEYYRKTGRTMRFCHPRDLLRQIKIYYEFLDENAEAEHRSDRCGGDRLLLRLVETAQPSVSGDENS